MKYKHINENGSHLTSIWYIYIFYNIIYKVSLIIKLNGNIFKECKKMLVCVCVYNSYKKYSLKRYKNIFFIRLTNSLILSLQLV